MLNSLHLPKWRGKGWRRKGGYLRLKCTIAVHLGKDCRAKRTFSWGIEIAYTACFTSKDREQNEKQRYAPQVFSLDGDGDGDGDLEQIL